MSNSLIASDKQLLHRELFVRLSGAYFPRYWSLEIFAPVFRYSHGRPNAAILIEFRIT